MQIYVDKRKCINHTEFLVYNHLFQKIFVGNAQHILSYLFGKITLGNELNGLTYCLKQTSLIRKVLSIIPIVSMFVDCPYHYYKNGVFVGKTKQKYASNQIKVNGNTYWIRLHTGCKISIWINDVQVGIVDKVKTSGTEDERYSVLFSKKLEIELAALFTLFASMIFLEDYGMPEVRYTNVLFDKYNVVEWKPDEE